jgi:hypothetical protein
MSIAVIKVRKEPHYRRAAIESGLKRLGYTIADERSQPAAPADLLVLWNRKAGAEEASAEDWERKHGTVIVMENGYLQKVDKTTYAISTHQHNGAGWFPVGDEDRFSKLGFEVKPWRTGGVEVLVRDQRGIGSKLMASPPQWGPKTVAALKHKTNLSVRLVPHPGNFAPKVPVEQDLRNAAMFVTWCSAMGVRALVEGIPVFHGAPHWVISSGARPLSSFPDLHNYPNIGRHAALHRMSHGQWHFDEIATGEPFARMRDAGWGPRTWA